MTARRVLGIGACAIAVAAVVLVLLPFRTTIPVRGNDVSLAASLRSSCGPPITEAWRTDRTLHLRVSSSHPEAPAGVGCPRPARKRLRIAATGLAAALVLGVAARFVRR